MNQGGKWIGVAFFGVTTQVVFWIIYSQTENIVGSIGITSGVCISISGVLYWLDKLDQRKQQ